MLLLRQIAYNSCLTVAFMGLVYYSSRRQASMNESLVRMGEEATRAAQLKTAADSEWSLSAETHDKAVSDRAEGEALHEQAEAIFEKASEETELAAAVEAKADEEAAKAAEEEEQALAHFARAGSLQTVVDADRIKALAESTAASRTANAVRANELGIGLCEMVPLLDVFCDFIGGTTSVGFEATAAKEAAESTALIAAAAEAETKEKAELALATEFQSVALADGDVAAADHAGAAELEANAEVEMADAEEDEEVSQEKLGQSIVEEEAAEQEEGEALAEEEQSDASFAKAASYGVAACWDACCATFIAALAVGFFAVRLLPIYASSACAYVSRVAANGLNTPALRRISQGYHHFAIFGLALGCFAGLLSSFDLLHVRARGGIVLLLALAASVANALLIYALPKVWSSGTTSTTHVVKSFSRAFLESLTGLWIWFILEFLFLRVTFGGHFLSSDSLTWLCHWYLWIICAATIFAHHWFFERQENTPSELPLVEVYTGIDSPSTNVSSASSYGSVTDNSWSSSLESVSLTSSDGTEEQTSSVPPRYRVILARFQQYQLALDVLVTACAVAVLCVCLPNVKHLWPVSRTIILAAHPHWWLIVACCGVAIAGAGAVWHLRKSRL